MRRFAQCLVAGLLLTLITSGVLFGQALPPAAADYLTVHLAGTETITGAKTFTGGIVIGNFSVDTDVSYGWRVATAKYNCLDSSCTANIRGDGAGNLEMSGGLVMATANKAISNSGTSAPVLLNDVDGTCIGNGTGTNCDGALSAATVSATGYVASTANGAGAPTASDCDADAERGRTYHDTTNNRLYFCAGQTRGWDYVALTD